MHLPYYSKIQLRMPPDFGTNVDWVISELKPITVLFGKNGSGKSRFLRIWRDNIPQASHYIIPERPGNLNFEPSYMNQQRDGASRKATAEHNFFADYRTHVITRIQTYFLARGSSRKEKLSGDPAELEGLLNRVLPDFTVMLNGLANPPYQLHRTANNQRVDNVNALSSGEAQLLTVALDIVTVAALWELEEQSERVMFIDEPDAHIHPDLQVRFADFLVRASERFDLQVVIATHSTSLLAALGQFAGNDTGVVYLDRTKTSFKSVPFAKELRELASCLGGHALMGPLFGVPLLLVEGDDDYRIWSQVPRHHNVSFAVIPCNGDEIRKYQKSLENILAALRTATGIAGFALLDGDKVIPRSTDVAQQHVKFIGLKCHEAENLFICDEVLALLNLDWATASAKIAAESSKYGQKSSKLAGAPQWDRKSEDIKNVIDEITKILDVKNVHWTARVAKAIGVGRPSGQLLDFLGNDLVADLWGPSPIDLSAGREAAATVS